MMRYGRHRGHHRTLDIAAASAVDQRRGALLGARRGRIEIKEPGALVDRSGAGLRHRHGLAGGNRGDDEVRFRRQLGVRGRKRHTVFRRMLLQRRALLAPELDVISRDLDVLLAQILGQDFADFAVADQPDLPSFRIHHQFSPRVVSSNSSSTA
ncbi:hypothetical protein ABIG07_007575 [Bradyrhizobium ottawaense]|uniref:Uncharacterized protein n=1 Tax=Bradyrhizobium ottawaense TaxID=931866 RepID=A0ABV4G556_9BRAD